MRIMRLGQCVDATGDFAPEALQRTRSALTNYAELSPPMVWTGIGWSRGIGHP
jgi:exopolyphosphatase/pppGpp-phosphohydrolase